MRLSSIGTMRRCAAVAVACAIGGCALLAASAATGHAAPATHTAHVRLNILGAASLSLVFPDIAPLENYTFNGSGALEADIQQGAPADVYAAANRKDPEQLYAAGLVYQPVEFATNLLVMVVPKDNPAHITSVADITKPGVKIVVCNSTVPCGDYAATAFANLGITAAADKNIVSEDTDVTQVLAQIAAGQGDVGFVYITDAISARGKVTAIQLPAQAMPHTVDYIAVVKGTPNLPQAQAFVKLVRSAKGQKILRAAGFGTG